MGQIFKMASQLLKTGDEKSVEKGLGMFRSEVDANPSDMKALFEYAGAFDYLGRESEALPLYEKVLNSGFEKLPSDDQPRLFVQLGSTLRNLEKFSESREILSKGLKLFPEYKALQVFLSLTEYSSGDSKKAMQILFNLLSANSKDPSLADYSRALKWYFENIST